MTLTETIINLVLIWGAISAMIAAPWLCLVVGLAVMVLGWAAKKEEL